MIFIRDSSYIFKNCCIHAVGSFSDLELIPFIIYIGVSLSNTQYLVTFWNFHFERVSIWMISLFNQIHNRGRWDTKDGRILYKYNLKFFHRIALKRSMNSIGDKHLTTLCFLIVVSCSGSSCNSILSTLSKSNENQVWSWSETIRKYFI